MVAFAYPWLRYLQAVDGFGARMERGHAMCLEYRNGSLDVDPRRWDRSLPRGEWKTDEHQTPYDVKDRAAIHFRAHSYGVYRCPNDWCRFGCTWNRIWVLYET